MQDRLGPGYTLLRFRGAPDTTALERAMRATGAPFGVLEIADDTAREVYGRDLLLLRPDLHVAWRGNVMPDEPDKLAALATGH